MDNNFNLYATITKIDEDLRLVEGYASTEAIDSQGEIVTKQAISSALPNYMKFGNVREMHQPKAAGKARTALMDDKGLFVEVKVVADDAWKLVKEGVYQGFSIGGRVKSKIKNKITDLELVEISLVDRPANPEAVFTMYKVDDSGNISDFNTTNMKQDEIIIKDDEVKEEVVEEAVEPVEEVEVEEVTKAKKKEVEEVVEEVVEEKEAEEVVEEQPAVVIDEVQEKLDKVTESLGQLTVKFDALMDKVASLEAQNLTKVAEVSEKSEKSKPIASYVIDKMDDSKSKEVDSLRAELDKIYEQVDVLKLSGQQVPAELTDRGLEILSKLKQ